MAGDFRFDRVHAGFDVVEVAVAEILAVGGGEGLTLAEAAARVGGKDEIAELRPDRAGKGGTGRGRRASVDADDEGVLLARVEVDRVGEPALDVVPVVFPLDGLGAGGGLDALVQVGELLEGVGLAEEKLGCLGVALLNKGDGAVAGDGDGSLDGAARYGDFTEVVGDAGRDHVLVDVGVVEQRVAATVFDEADLVGVEPGFPDGRAVDAGSDVGGFGWR